MDSSHIQIGIVCTFPYIDSNGEIAERTCNVERMARDDEGRLLYIFGIDVNKGEYRTFLRSNIVGPIEDYGCYGGEPW